MSGDVSLAEYLASQGLPEIAPRRPVPPADDDPFVAAYVNRNSDETIRADHPGISDEDIRQWRERSAAVLIGEGPWS